MLQSEKKPNSTRIAAEYPLNREVYNIFLKCNSSDEIESTLRSRFVKIILLKSNNCVLALQKRRFYRPKQPLLPCKTYAFRTRNNRFCNTLINK
ncbi:hypothetical protein CTM62_02885 [Prevotella intermedia]|uniref:Uncharacterized protein n=1 Tax=Prevotella intermedia TaxID=28131 RepID=A0A2D3L5B6_PREIN|nr:hypothetical protein CTM62_02885 [Prevotella intermedia]